VANQGSSVTRGVTVIGDLMRPDGQGRAGGVDRPTVWLFNALKRQVGLACGLPVSVLTTAHLPDFTQALTSERSREDSALHWAAGFAALRDTSAFDRHVLPHMHDCFCIGYELPPWLTAILHARDIPHIDLRIHPVRFLDDLIFAVRAGHSKTQAKLLPMALTESEVIATAGLREAMCQLITSSSLPEDTLLVLGQRPMDSTQIVDGDHSLLVAAAGCARNLIGVTNDNIYRLLSLPQISAVLTVNSSSAVEAGYFGKTVHALAPPPLRLAWAGDVPDPVAHAGIGDVVLTPDFWRTVLAPYTAVSPPDGMRLPAKPNRLRIALDSFWNYQEIDSDRVPPRPG
jgi:hypothetical protein